MATKRKKASAARDAEVEERRVLLEERSPLSKDLSKTFKKYDYIYVFLGTRKKTRGGIRYKSFFKFKVGDSGLLNISHAVKLMIKDYSLDQIQVRGVLKKN